MKHLYKLKIIIFLLVLFTLLLTYSNFATAQVAIGSPVGGLPFGGIPILISPCNTGFLYVVINPMGVGTGLYMFPLPLLGPQVLGLFVPAPIPCILGIIPMGFGFPAIYFNPV